MRIKVGLTVGLLLLVCVIAWMALRTQESDPIVQGKPLSYWLARYDVGGAFSRAKADEIVSEAGTNAIPTLLRMLRKRDSALKTKLIRLSNQQHILKLKFLPAFQLHYRAGVGFAKLGVSASNAVPELLKIYDENISNSSRFWVINSIGSISSAEAKTIPFLVSALGNTSMEVRLSCITSLQTLHASPEVSVPALIRALQDQEAMVRYYAIVALGTFGSHAKAALPALTNLVHDLDRNVRQGATALVKRLQQAGPDKNSE